MHLNNEMKLMWQIRLGLVPVANITGYFRVDVLQDIALVQMEYIWLVVVRQIEAALMVRVWVGLEWDIKVVLMEQLLVAVTSKASFPVWLLFFS